MLLYETRIVSLLRDGFLQLRGDLEAAINILAKTRELGLDNVALGHSVHVSLQLENLLLQMTELLTDELSNYTQSLRVAVFEIILSRNVRLGRGEARYRLLQVFRVYWMKVIRLTITVTALSFGSVTNWTIASTASLT